MAINYVPSARQVLCQNLARSVSDHMAMENVFFSSIRLPNGARKTTAAARLADIDRAVCEHLRCNRRVHLLDVGISSGITTLELLSRLEAQGAKASGVGMDLCNWGMLRSFLG